MRVAQTHLIEIPVLKYPAWPEQHQCKANKNNLVLWAMVLKTLGRVGSVFFKSYKDPNGIFVKKSLGSAGSDR